MKISDWIQSVDLVTLYMICHFGSRGATPADVRTAHDHLDFETPIPNGDELERRLGRLEACGVIRREADRAWIREDLRVAFAAAGSRRALGWRRWWHIHSEMGRPFRHWVLFREVMARCLDDPGLLTLVR